MRKFEQLYDKILIIKAQLLEISITELLNHYPQLYSYSYYSLFI